MPSAKINYLVIIFFFFKSHNKTCHTVFLIRIPTYIMSASICADYHVGNLKETILIQN